jgi:3-hydroxyisobutyrate dehydrogenase-like beta-hydroxyacid dehydrogenase
MATRQAEGGKPVIGVIGLGIMGGIMAETLRAAGYAVCGYDVAPTARARLKRAGGAPLASVTAVVARAEIIITSLATSAALRTVITELTDAASATGALPLVIETSTLPLADKDFVATRARKARLAVLDCPISGTATRMKERTWTIFVSGPKAAAKRADPILRCFTDNLPHVGPFGHGTRLKYAANHLVAIYNVAYGEVVTFARAMGVDPQVMLNLFGPSPVLGTGVMRLRMPFMVERRYEPPTMKVEVWQKDMQVIGDMAKSLGCPVPLFNACAPIYTAAMGQGLALKDTASVAEVLGAMAGMEGFGPARAGASCRPSR